MLINDGELGLFRAESVEAALHKLLEDADQRETIYVKQHFENGCVLSTTRAPVKVITDGVVSLVRLLQEDDLNHAEAEVILELDHDEKLVKWKFKECECVTSLPGEGPIYVIYCTGYYNSGVEFI